MKFNIITRTEWVCVNQVSHTECYGVSTSYDIILDVTYQWSMIKCDLTSTFCYLLSKMSLELSD